MGELPEGGEDALVAGDTVVEIVDGVRGRPRRIMLLDVSMVRERVFVERRRHVDEREVGGKEQEEMAGRAGRYLLETRPTYRADDIAIDKCSVQS